MKPKNTRGWVVGVVLAAGTVGGSAGPAYAAGGDDPTAQALFDQGRQLMREGRFAEACPKLEDSDRLAPGIGTKFNLADCYEQTGRLASAWAEFLKVAAATKLKGQSDRERVARDRARALEPRLARLEVQVTEPAPGLELERDGQGMVESAWAIPIPVDAGPHRLGARATGKRPWSAAFTAQDGQVVRVVVPKFEDEPLPEKGASEGVVVHGPAEKLGTTAHTPASSGVQKTLGWVALGGSAVFLGAGVVGLIERNAAVSGYNADSSCPPFDQPGRSSDCQRRVSNANTWQTVSIAGFVGGGSLLLTSAILLLSAPKPGDAAHAHAFACGTGPGTIGVGCGGVF